MDEIKLFKALLYVGGGFLVFYLLEKYVFQGETNIWRVVFLPMTYDIIRLGYRSYTARKRKTEPGFVALKRTRLEISDFSWIVLGIIIVAYVREDLLLYLFPVITLNCFFLYYTKKNQLYYFEGWTIYDLSEKDKDIVARNIISYDIQPNKLEIKYLNNEDDDPNDEDDIERLFIRRHDLEFPHSWFAFEKIVTDFQDSINEKRENYSSKKVILDA